MDENSLVMDLSDDDEEKVLRTIELQKSLISESQSLLNTQIEFMSDRPLKNPGGQNDSSPEDAETTVAVEDEAIYCNALTANLEYDNYLARLETNLKKRISEYKTNVSDLASLRKDLKGTKNRSSFNGRGNHVYIFGAPFFKDKDYYPCPPNADTISKAQNMELCWVDLPPLRWWRPSQTKQLVDTIKEQSLHACKTDSINEKKALIRRRDALTEDNEEKKKLDEEINNFSIDNYVSSHINEKIATMDHDWLKLSASILNGKHSAEECQGFWNNFLHPKFHKGDWTKEEDLKLRNLADEYNCQNWDLIAEQLGTGRSGYQCFAQYQSETAELSKQRWTDEEDLQLKALVEKFRVGDYIPWGQVAIYMRGRTKTQVYNRWTYSLDPKIKKGRFTLQEDIIILRGVQKWGEDFQKIASYMPDRMAPQIRIRYHSGICKGVNFEPWTKEEDSTLLALVQQHGHNWVQIAKHLPGKSAYKLRRRHNTLMKQLKANPGKPVSEVTSRRSSKKDIYNAYPELWAFADKVLSGGNQMTVSTSLLSFRAQAQAGVPKAKRTASKLSLIDEKLAEYFQGTYSKPTTLANKFTSLPECDPKLISDVASFLELLGAKLNIPCDQSLDADESLDGQDRQILKGLRSAHPNVLFEAVSDFEAATIDNVADRVGVHNDICITPDNDVTIDYVQPSDPSSTQISLPFSFTDPLPVSCTTATIPAAEAPTVKPGHPLFGHLKYLCPPNFSTLVGLRSILLGKRKLVESVSDFATDPVICDFEEMNKNESFRRHTQLWDDRLMCLFALANMVCKVKPPPSEQMDIRGVSSPCQPGPSTSAAVPVFQGQKNSKRKAANNNGDGPTIKRKC